MRKKMFKNAQQQLNSNESLQNLKLKLAVFIIFQWSQMSRRVSFWIPAFWTIVVIEPLSLLMPTADLKQPFLVSESARF